MLLNRANEPSWISEQAGTIPPGTVPHQRLLNAKKAYTTRFFADSLETATGRFYLEAGPDVVPSAGDLVLTTVETVGHLPRLESPASRRQVLFPGDEIVVAYAHRYAPDQVLAEVPGDLGPCQLIAAGGLAGSVLASHGAVGRPTRLMPLGLLADAAGRLNLRRLAPHQLDRDAAARVSPHVVAVLGSSMNSGKSTAAACLIRGLTNAGLRVTAGKVTGTGSGNDPRLFHDAGASLVLDFTDFGFPTTFRLEPGSVSALLGSMVGALAVSSPEVIVIEIADGLLQQETRALVADPLLRGLADTVVFTAADALSAVAGVRALREAGLEPSAVSGKLTISPLAAQEAAAVIEVPLLETYALTEASTAMSLLTARAQ